MMIFLVALSLMILPTIGLVITIYDVLEHQGRNKHRPPISVIRRPRSLTLVSAMERVLCADYASREASQ